MLLDFATASLTYVPMDDFDYLEYPRLAGDTVSFYAIGKQSDDQHLYVIDRERPQAPDTWSTFREAASRPLARSAAG